MKTVTIHVSEQTYRAFQEAAAAAGRSAAELIREAMEEFYDRRLAKRGSIFDGAAAEVGRTLRPLSSDDDLLEEMLE